MKWANLQDDHITAYGVCKKMLHILKKPIQETLCFRVIHSQALNHSYFENEDITQSLFNESKPNIPLLLLLSANVRICACLALSGCLGKYDRRTRYSCKRFWKVEISFPLIRLCIINLHNTCDVI